MLCSTVIPTINRPTLERAIQSVLDQDIDSTLHEIIVVNDSGKPLGEKEWLKSSPVQITVVNTNRCERSFACNVGATVATGKYLKILHDDDWLLPGGLKALLNVAETTGSYWIYGALRRVDFHGNVISDNRPEVQGNIFALLVSGETIHLGPSLLRRDAFFRVGGFHTDFKVNEDRDLSCRIALIGSFARTDHLVACVRIGTEGSSTEWARMTQESRLVRERALSAAVALERLRDSVRADPFLRGRACRSYLISAALNAKAGNVGVAVGRLASCLKLAIPYSLSADFRRGISYSFGRQENRAYRC